MQEHIYNLGEELCHEAVFEVVKKGMDFINEPGKCSGGEEGEGRELT